MTPVSIAKVFASASVLIAAGSGAIVFGVAYVQHDQRLAAAALTPRTGALHGAPTFRSDGPPLVSQTSPAHLATQAPTALPATGVDLAAIADELAGPPADQSLPSFDIARVEVNGDAVIAGRAAPGATVDLLRRGERLARAVAGPSGEFVMIPSRLPAGSYELRLSAKLPDGTVASSKHDAAITVIDTGLSAHAEQSRAEYVPETEPQPQSSSKPRLRIGKPQENAGSQSAPAIHAGSASDEAPSSWVRAISRRVVSRGDSLWRISRISYGDGSRYALVYRANRERIRNPNLIYPGQTLVLPVKRN